MNLLQVKDLCKFYDVKEGIFGKKKLLKAVNGIDFSIKKNEVFALVGESGCGKSTVARIILKLLDSTSGEIIFKEQLLSTLKGESLKAYRRSVQIIFQDPFASLNPRMKIVETLTEPFKVHKNIPKSEYKEKAAELLMKVGLSADQLNRYPHEFSGGQRQRICIARALTLSPELIVADEPLSALDVSIQAQILNLLAALREERGLSFLFISHNLDVVRYFSDKIAVMYLGEIVERAESERMFENPLHPYTQLLIDSMPKIRESCDEIKPVNNEELQTDVPSPIDIPPGCPFHPRCPKRFEPCDREKPTLKEYKGSLVSCFLFN